LQFDVIFFSNHLVLIHSITFRQNIIKVVHIVKIIQYNILGV